MKTFAAITCTLLLALLAGCSRPDYATSLLEAQGYKSVQVHPWNFFTFFQCSEDDLFKTPFIATAPNGEAVSGVVCSGLLKGSTIRFD